MAARVHRLGRPGRQEPRFDGLGMCWVPSMTFLRIHGCCIASIRLIFSLGWAEACLQAGESKRSDGALIVGKVSCFGSIRPVDIRRVDSYAGIQGVGITAPTPTGVSTMAQRSPASFPLQHGHDDRPVL